LSRISGVPEKELEIESSDAPSETAYNEERRGAKNWPLIIGVSTVAVQAAVLADLDPVVRAPLVLWFCLFCTGMAWVRLLNIPGPLAEAVAAVALSIALSGLVSGATLYAGHWSPKGAMIILEAITFVGAALGLYLASRRPDRQ